MAPVASILNRFSQTRHLFKAVNLLFPTIIICEDPWWFTYELQILWFTLIKLVIHWSIFPKSPGRSHRCLCRHQLEDCAKSNSWCIPHTFLNCNEFCAGHIWVSGLRTSGTEVYPAMGPPHLSDYSIVRTDAPSLLPVKTMKTIFHHLIVWRQSNRTDFLLRPRRNTFILSGSHWT